MSDDNAPTACTTCNRPMIVSTMKDKIYCCTKIVTPMIDIEKHDPYCSLECITNLAEPIDTNDLRLLEFDDIDFTDPPKCKGEECDGMCIVEVWKIYLKSLHDTDCNVCRCRCRCMTDLWKEYSDYSDESEDEISDRIANNKRVNQRSNKRANQRDKRCFKCRRNKCNCDGTCVEKISKDYIKFIGKNR